MVVRCGVAICPMTTELAKNSEVWITFHRFPKDENFQLKWIKRCGWNVNPSTARLCSLHFQASDFDDSRELQYKLMGIKSQRLLKKTAIPTVNVCEEISPARQDRTYLGQNKPKPIDPKPPALIYYGSKISTFCDLTNEDTFNKKLVKMPTQSILDEHTVSDNTVSSEAVFQEHIEKPKALSEEVVAKLCRLCLEEKQTMWSFFSVLTFDDGSIIDISQTFQSLTGEASEKMENPKFPPHICEGCLDLLTNAHTFQQKYEESTRILNEYLAKEPEENATYIKLMHEQDIIDNINETAESNQDINETRSHTFEFISTGEVPTNNNVLTANTGSYSKEFSALEFSSTTKETCTLKTFTKETNNGGTPTSTETEETITLTITEEVPAEATDEATVKLHRCPICPQEFTALELKMHCHTHKALKSYLKSAPKYNKKVKFFAKPRPENKGLFNQEKIFHTCPFCQEEFESEPFRDHIKQHRSEGNFRCNICNRIFLGINHLKMHQLSHKKEAPFKCKFCKKSFFLQINYDFHLLKHSDNNELPFKCDFCEKAFSNPEHLKRHRFSHVNEVSYHTFYKREMLYVKCKQCLQKFKTEEEREAHSCKLCCAKCYQLFESKSTFNTHVCKSKLKRSQCSPCGKVFLLPSSLKTHKFRCKTRTLCYVCGKNVRNITLHLLTHYPNKRAKTIYKCAQCNKPFSYRENLARHIKEVHSDIVRYHCQYCSKGFKGKWNLQVHERIHLGVKAHVCNICGKRFLEKSYLKKHFRVHLRREGLVDPCEI